MKKSIDTAGNARFALWSALLTGLNGVAGYVLREKISRRKEEDWSPAMMVVRRETCGVLVKNQKQEDQMNAMHDMWFKNNQHRLAA